MPLNFDLTKIPESVRTITVDGETQMNPRTQSLILACQAVGLSGITRSGAAQFYARVVLFETLVGPIMGTADGPKPITATEHDRQVVLDGLADAASHLYSQLSMIDGEADRFSVIDVGTGTLDFEFRGRLYTADLTDKGPAEA